MDSLMEPSQTTDLRYEFMVHTFGCKVNTYDTGLLQKRFEALGHKHVKEFGSGRNVPRVHILNTCAVTAEASKEAAKLARRLKSRDPFSTVVVTGCGAQVDGEIFDQMKGIDLVVANSHKGALERILDQYFKGTLTERVFRSNIFRKSDLEAGGGTEAAHTRAFLKIQDGCNSFCTYCVIPFARGRSRSIPIAELVRKIRELEARGTREVVLTGVHIGDYEDERAGQKLGLRELVAEVLERTTIPRVRLSSLEPVELSYELLALYRDERMCPHFHMSIQSANTRVLKAMRRKYDAEAVEWSLQAIASEVPGAFVGMDVIAGFPGETDDEFADTYERLARLPWTRIHVFPYSERPGTKAAKLDGVVPRSVRALRSERLRTLSSERFAENGRKQVGTIKRALILKAPGQGAEALSRDYWPIRLISPEGETGVFSPEELHALAGREITVRVTGFKDADGGRMDGVLLGEWVRNA